MPDPRTNCEFHPTRPAVALAPRHTGGDVDKPAHWVPICAEHLATWYDDVDEDERLPILPLDHVLLSASDAREYVKRAEFEAGDEGSNDGEHDLLMEVADALRESLTTVTSSDKRPTALLESDRANFDTLLRAVANDDVFLLHARERATGHGHALICIKSVVPDSDGEDDVDVFPIARLLDEDPTETYTNPADDVSEPGAPGNDDPEERHDYDA